MSPDATSDAAVRRPRRLALTLVDELGTRIRDGRWRLGDKLPTEATIMGEFGVSRTVVREAISKLQAAGLVETRHGIGTFVHAGADVGEAFRIDPERLGTLRDVVALLELRIGIETEAAALAAARRTPHNLEVMREALEAFAAAMAAGDDAVASDFAFHVEIARATQNTHFVALMNYLGAMAIPRARLAGGDVVREARADYLRRVQGEHQSILDAIASQDADAARAAMRTHLANSRERRRRAAAQSLPSHNTPETKR